MENRLESRIAAGTSINKTLRNDHPIVGWPLLILAWLDRTGARGLLADLAVAGPLTRQAAFIAAVDLDVDAPRGFLDRLGIEAEGAEGVGIALRTRHARDLIAAIYEVAPQDVPSGYLRALARIQEGISEAPGLDPLDRCESYRRLFEIMSGDQNDRKVNALRYCGKMRSSSIHAVLTLDPVLIWPEIIRHMGSRQQVERANAFVAMIRETASQTSDDDLVVAMRQSLRSGNALEAFARRAIERADRLPVPHLPATSGVRLLTTDVEYRDHAERMRNCVMTKLPEAVLGQVALLEVAHREDDESESTVAVSLTPMTSGVWAVSSVTGVKNARPSQPVLRATLRRLHALGILIPGPSSEHWHKIQLSSLIGVFRYGSFDEAFQENGDGFNEALRDLEDTIEEAA